MTSCDPLDSLLEKLCSGDEAVAEQLFLAYEPYLRMVVRRRLPVQLRAKFDSIDIVQSVWADLLIGFRNAGWCFTNGAQLRAFLIKVTRERFIDRLRKHRVALEREQSLSRTSLEDLPPSRQPPPSEEVQAEELWERMLTLCPPVHHELLRLKRRGSPLSEIAEQTGLHKSSVRRILYTLARRLGVKRKKAPSLAPPKR